MKLIFKYQFESVPAAAMGSLGLIRYVPICTGGCFVDGKEEQTVDLTDYSVVLKNKDYVKANQDYLSSFFHKEWWEEAINPNNHAYVGRWPKDESDIKMYYFVQDGIIHKMFATKFNELAMSSLGGIQYIIEFNGKMMDSIPEEGDIIFSTLKEAEEYKKKVLKKHNDLR